MDRPEGRTEHPVTALSELRIADHTLDSLVEHVASVAMATLPGWDAAAATVIEGERVATFGITDERVAAIDQSQYENGAGPCVDSSDGELRYWDGESTEPRWKAFAEAAEAEGIHSVASFPLKFGDDIVGALNFYSRERSALHPGQREEALLYAAQAAVALANARDFEAQGAQVKQLEEGLQTRTMIGQATGILMAQEGLSSEEAFQRLVHVSQASNLKLRDIAQRYVEAWEKKTEPGTGG